VTNVLHHPNSARDEQSITTPVTASEAKQTSFLFDRMKGIRAPRKRNLIRDRRGNAALEFAIIVPLIILMGIGAVEYSAAIRAQMQVDQAAHTVANLIANQPANVPITALQLQDYYQAAQDVYNFSGRGGLSVSAASVNYTNQDAAGNKLPSAANPTNPTVAVGWDAAGAAGSNYTAFPGAGSSSPIGELVATGSDTVNNDSVIVVVASAPFQIPFLPNFYGGKLPAALSFRVLALARPRYELQVAKGF
jgi:Flp pilus assembly protein TadG